MTVQGRGRRAWKHAKGTAETVTCAVTWTSKVSLLGKWPAPAKAQSLGAVKVSSVCKVAQFPGILLHSRAAIRFSASHCISPGCFLGTGLAVRDPLGGRFGGADIEAMLPWEGVRLGTFGALIPEAQANMPPGPTRRLIVLRLLTLDTYEARTVLPAASTARGMQYRASKAPTSYPNQYCCCYDYNLTCGNGIQRRRALDLHERVCLMHVSGHTVGGDKVTRALSLLDKHLKPSLDPQVPAPERRSEGRSEAPSMATRIPPYHPLAHRSMRCRCSTKMAIKVLLCSGRDSSSKLWFSPAWTSPAN
ncbi:hypothetical protein TgHK011_002506 [Trichoderma gracile]|nr:hypothetical protein TgHK011_002506 [Trichoderma gracile]